MQTVPSPDVYVKQWALRPAVVGRIYERLPISDWNLTDATVTFSMWEVLEDETLGAIIVDTADAEVVDAALRIVQYQWVDGDTGFTGKFAGLFVVTFTAEPGSSPLIVPTHGYVNIYIDASETPE